MNKKIISIVLSFFVLSNEFCMEPTSKKRKSTPSQKELPAKRVKKIPVKLLPTNGASMIIPHVYYGGRPVVKKKEETENSYIQGELIDLSEKDVIKQDSFANLIREKHEEGLPYIFAAVLVQEGEGLFARRYQDAGGLVGWMFHPYFFSIMSQERQKHVITQQTIIDPILFFIWYPGESEIEYFGSSVELIGLTVGGSAYTSKKFKQRMLRVNADKGSDKDLVYLGNHFFRIKPNVAEKYYLMAIEHDFGSAINNLGSLYERQGKFALAEQYYLMGAEKNQLLSIVNLIKLFSQQKTEKTTLEQLKQFYQYLQTKPDEIKAYGQYYPEDWKVIQETMQKIESQQ